MVKLKHKFKCWNTDEGCYEIIPVEETVEALYWAWNYEFNVYDVKTNELVFAPWEDNEFNSELLEPYGLRVIGSTDGRDFQSIETGKIYSPPWRKNDDENSNDINQTVFEEFLEKWESMTSSERNEWIHIYAMRRDRLSFLEGDYRYTEDMYWAWDVAKKFGIAAIPQSSDEGFCWYACDIKSVSYRGDEIAIKPSNDSGISKETASEAICASAFLSVLAEL